MKEAVLSILISLLISGCVKYKNEPGRHEILRINNNSDKDLYYTEGTCEGELTGYNFVGQLPAFIKRNDYVKKYQLGGFESDFRYCPYLYLLFVDAELLKVPYDTIHKYKMILYKRK